MGAKINIESLQNAYQFLRQGSDPVLDAHEEDGPEKPDSAASSVDMPRSIGVEPPAPSKQAKKVKNEDARELHQQNGSVPALPQQSHLTHQPGSSRAIPVDQPAPQILEHVTVRCAETPPLHLLVDLPGSSAVQMREPSPHPEDQPSWTALKCTVTSYIALNLYTCC
ncbi:unnamed protein product [Haemonchus placei]|uniref:Uncharacterized protein n=1 Tax=Haemonchus placei TaxID=6290 RepID=A0A0N4WH32_HAEPC|nr:unnamed protein product [Haemonchus placei]